MVGRPGGIKSKGSEASNSQDGDTPIVSRKKQGRPRKSRIEESPRGSRDSTPFSPANPRALRRRPLPDGTRLANAASEFDAEEDMRTHRIARFLEAHPHSREEYAKWMEEKSSFPPWIAESERIEYDGTVFTRGDIVCLFDENDEDEEDLPYYAQIRSMIRDQLMRPFAYITWLVPRRSSLAAHEFEAEHFVHSLIDHKRYELKCLRWVEEQPELPAYQLFDKHRAAIDQARLEEMRQRRLDLFAAANYAIEADADMIRAGDIKLLHSKEHEEDLKEVLERQREREQERMEDMEEAEAGRVGREGDRSSKDSVSTCMSRTLRSVSTEDLSDDEEEDGSERRRGFKRRATSTTSTTSKGTIESAPSPVQPPEAMDED